MANKDYLKEISVIILATVVLAIAVSFKTMRLTGADSLASKEIFYTAALCFFVILVINTIVKKIVGNYFQTDVKIKFWSWYQYGFRKDWHFKKALPMIWLPLVASLFTRGFFLWLGVLEFDVEAKTSRVAKRHGLYRFAEVTEHHMGWIATWALIINLLFAVVGYILGFELFTKLSIYFVAWSVIPLSSLDGSKILFGGRVKWGILFTIAMILFIWALAIL